MEGFPDVKDVFFRLKYGARHDVNCLPGSSGIVMQFRLQEVLFQSTSKEKYIKEELLGLSLIHVFDRYVFKVMNTVVG